MRSQMDGYTLGIDFGTTNSAVAVYTDAGPETLAVDDGYSLLPSVAYYPDLERQKRPDVGRAAVNQASKQPERVVQSVKLAIGSETNRTVTVPDRTLTPTDVAADIIRALRLRGAKQLDIDHTHLTRAAITVPAYWDVDRRNTIKRAGEAAGFETVTLLNEPAAAALDHGEYNTEQNKIIGVFDLGGGTFDFSILRVKSDVNLSHTYDVLGQAGDRNLGGDDWDTAIASWVEETIMDETGYDPREQQPFDSDQFAALRRREQIRREAQAAKHDLSDPTVSETAINMSYIFDGQDQGYTISKTLTQQTFEQLTEHLRDQLLAPIDQAVSGAKENVDNPQTVESENLDTVLLVGGSTKMPQIHRLVEQQFSQPPVVHTNPDKAVARGAAIRGNKDELILTEVTPLSIGVGLRNDRFKPLIERSSTLPASASDSFFMSDPAKSAIRVPVYQGERPIASENTKIGDVVLTGFDQLSTQTIVNVDIEVTRTGLITVRTGTDKGLEYQEATFEGATDLPDDYVEQKLAEAEAHEQADRQRERILKSQSDAADVVSKARRLAIRYEQLLSEVEYTKLREQVTALEQLRTSEETTLSQLQQATEEVDEYILSLVDVVNTRAPADNETLDTPQDNTQSATAEQSQPQNHAGADSATRVQMTSTAETDPNTQSETATDDPPENNSETSLTDDEALSGEAQSTPEQPQDKQSESITQNPDGDHKADVYEEDHADDNINFNVDVDVDSDELAKEQDADTETGEQQSRTASPTDQQEELSGDIDGDMQMESDNDGTANTLSDATTTSPTTGDIRGDDDVDHVDPAVSDDRSVDDNNIDTASENDIEDNQLPSDFPDELNSDSGQAGTTDDQDSVPGDEHPDPDIDKTIIETPSPDDIAPRDQTDEENDG